ncbi:hypothetical protein [Cupriavidus plantarum]|uniref:Copper resistance protein CopQ n=1 Tax=Cupriavidus plantarum TaxID=942865 RepID=A0A316ENN4_9BURK|nr:hypothetical protein [Cupriavidus plantarum]NYI01753.1 hypothetical protein [Cupriavidus plantarum]PWK33888.1 hypothetical protein C7419_103207 [Cupriavidus plantarum]REE91065.1 hypothetical protein C7418_4364 [Cupriavidus plantarum]RLK33738.1 hypothetical protein C7417_4388 [Cupriavidus plantarum]CAG2147899.1 hypothetical protein LMG26296_04217 [Cupriavidus plantarum]
MNAKTILTAATFAVAAAFASGAAQAQDPVDSTHAGDRYGYNFRVNDARDVYSQGARISNRDGYTDGARITNRDGLVAGLDRTGVSAEPQRTRDVYTDGARTRDVYTDGARA